MGCIVRGEDGIRDGVVSRGRGDVYNWRRRKKARGRFFFFQAEDGIRGSVASRGLGDVYKGQVVR